MLAEADMPKEEINEYVLDGKGIHMLLSFWTNRTLVYALASSKAQPLLDTLRDLPTFREGSQYVNFLRNLDELNIDYLSETEKQKVFQEFGPEAGMKSFGRGIRRRLAPMLKGDMRRLKLAYSMLFSLPGTPVIVYGDELGMGDNLALDGRNSVRTPMQWSNSENGGFSTANPSTILHRLIDDPMYDYQAINVHDQKKDRDSMLNFIKELITLRRSYPAIGIEKFKPLNVHNDQVFALGYAENGASLIVFHNLAEEPCEVTLEKGVLKGMKEIFSDASYDALSDVVQLSGYGYRWFARE